MTNTYESVPDKATGGSAPPDVAAYKMARERAEAPSPSSGVTLTDTKQRGEAPRLRVSNKKTKDRSLSPPPPVPVRQHHGLSKTMSDPPSQKSPSSSSKEKYKDISLASVPLRSKKRGGTYQVATPPQEPAGMGHVEERESGMSMKFDVSSPATGSSRPGPVKDVSDVLTACAGLPSNGKGKGQLVA